MSLPPSLTLGPLVIATDRLVALLLIAGFLVFMSWLARRLDPSAERTGLLALVFGLIGARAGFVAENGEAFLGEPSSVFAFWQGGFSLIVGVAVALATVVIVSRSHWRAAVLQVTAVAALTSLYLGSQHLMTVPARPLSATIFLVNLDGRSVPVGTLRGRPLVINLWATWCPPCRRELPMLIAEAARSPVPILLVNQGEDEATIRKFLRSEGLAGPAIFRDPIGAIGENSGALALPTTLFVDNAGQIRSVHVGELSRAGLHNEIRQLQP